jgi:cell division protein FtsI (penicillin-binding protein 3)
MALVERRIGLLFAVFLGMLVLAGARAGWLGIVRADSLRSAAATQQKAEILVPARRGTITDANGIELAISKPAQTIAATPYLIDDPTKVARDLARILRRPEDELLRKLARRDTGFVYIARRVPTRRALRAQELDVEGLQFIPEYSREYPRGWMASQLLGNVGTDGDGLSGLEYRFDEQLRGQDGERRLVRDALGDTIELREEQRTIAGQDVRLTLDANIQDHTEEVLDEIGEVWRPKGATALVMDPRDGAILALANWPRVGGARRLRDPRAVLQRRRGADRPPARGAPVRPVGPALRLRHADGRRLAGRGGRDRAHV